jgi:hypothetical protein
MCQISRLHAQKIVEDGKGGFSNLLGMRFEISIFVHPTGFRVMPSAPEGFQNAFSAFDLLHGRRERIAAFGKIGNVPYKKAADRFLVVNSLQQHYYRLFVGVPFVFQRVSEEAVAQSEKLRSRTFGDLPDFFGFGWEPVVEQGEGPVGIDELFGIIVVSRDFANAEVLIEFEDDFGKIVQAPENFLAHRRAVIEVARDQPIDVVGAAFFVSHAKAGVPHLASVHTPRIQNLGMFANDLASEIEESFVVLLHRMVSLTIDDRDRPRVNILFLIEAGDQFVKRIEVVIMLRRLERVDNDRMNLALPRSARLFTGFPTVRWFLAHKGLSRARCPHRAGITTKRRIAMFR